MTDPNPWLCHICDDGTTAAVKLNGAPLCSKHFEEALSVLGTMIDGFSKEFRDG